MFPLILTLTLLAATLPPPETEPQVPIDPAPTLVVPADAPDEPVPVFKLEIVGRLRPKPLPGLYAGHVAGQAADVALTAIALGRGGREANPIMRPLGDNTWKMTAVKAGVGVLTMWEAERMWKGGHRKAAILMMVGVNALNAVVVVNNARVVRTMGR